MALYDLTELKIKFSADILIRLLQAFPNSCVNHLGEFIAHPPTNAYFALYNCESDLDVQCKVLEWLSRFAHKAMPYNTVRKNQNLHKMMLSRINAFLCTNFDEDDIALIYDRLGNRVNHGLTVEFVKSGYNLELLKRGS